MGNKSHKCNKNLKSMKLDHNDEENITKFYNKFLLQEGENKNTPNTSKNTIFNVTQFQNEVFLNLSINSIFFLNDYYIKKGLTRKIDNLEQEDILNLFYLLTKANQNDEDDFNIYYRKNSFFILYDLYLGKVGAFEKETQINLVKLADVFEFIVQIFINRHYSILKKSEQDLGIDYNSNEKKKSIYNFLKENLKCTNESEELVDLKSLHNFIDHTLYSLDSFLKNYFKLKFLQIDVTESLLTSVPVCTEGPSTVTIDQFLFFVLANPHIGSMKYAFKLYDCQKTGYNIPNLIYSFLGFPGPVIILVKHFDQTSGKETVLGMFLHSNIKECYEKFCGDDLCSIFELYPKMHFYKFVEDREKICFISSKNQKFSKVSPGIGLGFRYGKCRFWIDSNECFKKSYFNKYDDVFEEGSPFENPEQPLNVRK
jgi:hypothetical protein